MNYNLYLKSADWKRKRLAKYRNSRSKKCAICLDWKNLQVHHLIYRPELESTRNSDLRILCDRCHKTTHELINSGVIKFKSEKHQSRFYTIKNHVKNHLKLYPTREERLKRRAERDKYIKYVSIKDKEEFTVKHPEITRVVTREILERGRSYNNGYGIEQLRLFGFNNFPRRGWQDMVISQEWPVEIIDRFINLKNRHIKHGTTGIKLKKYNKGRKQRNQETCKI